MIGELYIDTVDAYTTYGIFVALSSYNELLAFPPLKSVEFNDWSEEDGIEVDLSRPALNANEFQISFVAHEKNNIGAFFGLLSNKAYHTFDFRTIERKYRLRLVSQSNMIVVRGMNLFTLQFSNDFPFPENYTYAAPQSTLVPATGYKIDGLDFAQYGTHILKGSRSDVMKSPAVKKNLIRNFNNINGVIYDDQSVRFQSKEATLNCLMRAENLTEFWRNYDALLYNLVRQHERRLYIDYIGRDYFCYYKSCKVTRFETTGKIWFEFALTFMFCNFRIPYMYIFRKVKANSLRLLGNRNFRFVK